MFRTLFRVLENKKSNLAKSKKIFPMISIAMFFSWFSWLSMVFLDPIKMDLFWVKYIGLILSITGVPLVVLSHLKIEDLTARNWLELASIQR